MIHQPENKKSPNHLEQLICSLCKMIALLVIIILSLLVYIFSCTKANYHSLFTPNNHTAEKATSNKAKEQVVVEWQAPSVDTVSNPANKKQLEYGKDLVVNTSHYFGQNGTVQKNATNGMNCQNCHLDAGTKYFGNNYSGVAPTYPKYRPRSGTVENVYKRINDCFERSLNGITLDSNSKEMQALAAYINFIGSNNKKGERPVGSGLKDIAFLKRAADPKKGHAAFITHCVSCHGANGSGKKADGKSDFLYPPLWGENSFNDGAGLFRLNNMARYIHSNMPLGASHDHPVLSEEEAWDIAAFVNSQPRPKKDIRNDWPKIKEKPFDHPFGPYADGFSELAHKFGPYQPIKAKIESLSPKKK